MRRIDLHTLREVAPLLCAGDTVLLSGTVYTARDAAHKKLIALLDANPNQPLPFSLSGAVIYYAGPTPTPPGHIIGSCGPTTSTRMDPYTPRLLSLGVAGMIGKGGRSPAVVDAIRQYGAVYFCALGGAGALAAKSVVTLREVAFPELDCESVKELTLRDFPVIVGIDAKGNKIV